MVDEINEIIWEKDYTPEIARKWSSDGRYEYVHKKYYIKCYFKIGGNKKETRHKYLCDESDETIDHYDHSDTDIKEEKTGKYIEHHSYEYFLFKDWKFNNQYYREYEFKKYKRTVNVLDNGKKIYGNWQFDDQYYK